jgi:hypothetical protein
LDILTTQLLKIKQEISKGCSMFPNYKPTFMYIIPLDVLSVVVDPSCGVVAVLVVVVVVYV